MTTRLNRLVTACQDLLDAGGCKVAHRQDAEALTEHNVRRRVVWLSDRGDVSEASRTGGFDRDGRRITCCALRAAEVRVFVYAETLELTEQLLDNVIASISQVLENVDFKEYALATQEDDSKKVGHVNRVQCAMLRFVLPLPVPDEITALPTSDYMSTIGEPLVLIEGGDEQAAIKADLDDPDPDPYPEDGNG